MFLPNSATVYSECKLISFNSERKGEFPRVCRVEIASIERLPQGTDADVRGVCGVGLTRAARILAVGAGGEGSVSVRSARSPKALSLWLLTRGALVAPSGARATRWSRARMEYAHARRVLAPNIAFSAASSPAVAAIHSSRFRLVKGLIAASHVENHRDPRKSLPRPKVFVLRLLAPSFRMKIANWSLILV